MKSIVVVSPQVENWHAFSAALGNEYQMDVIEVRTGAEAIHAVGQKTPVAVVIDQTLADMAGIELVVRMLDINALINVALVSDLSEEVFHETTEGLGILMKMPSIPDGQDAAEFYQCLTGVI